MGSDPKTSKRGLAILEKLRTKGNQDLAIKYRKLDGYPQEGFFNEEAYQKFPKNKRKGFAGYFINFYREVLKNNPSLSNTLDSAEFSFVLFDFYRYGNITKENLKRLNDTGCEWLFIDKNTDEEYKKKLKEGVYIRIGIDSKLEHIKKFLELNNQKEMLDYLTELVRSKGKFGPKLGRMVKSSTSGRDAKIINLRKMSARSLSVISKLDPTKKKDEHISKILEKDGFKMDPGAIRKIFSRKGKTVPEL